MTQVIFFYALSRVRTRTCLRFEREAAEAGVFLFCVENTETKTRNCRLTPPSKTVPPEEPFSKKKAFSLLFLCFLTERDSHDSDFILKSSRFSHPLAFVFSTVGLPTLTQNDTQSFCCFANGVLHPRSHLK